MSGRKTLRWCPLLVVVTLSLFLAWPAPAAADGGPWTEDRDHWTRLQEVEQIAVVNLESSQAAHVDLFVSLLDSGGETQVVALSNLVYTALALAYAALVGAL